MLFAGFNCAFAISFSLPASIVMDTTICTRKLIERLMPYNMQRLKQNRENKNPE